MIWCVFHYDFNIYNQQKNQVYFILTHLIFFAFEQPEFFSIYNKMSNIRLNGMEWTVSQTDNVKYGVNRKVVVR